ncbi:hypothetical protein DFS34DRAFT_404235 [Phlyctochytrium arcticum]|nr:hypothetical protein DFS34DRAFT_404235 [Phlyctochytrium arcticum]
MKQSYLYTQNSSDLLRALEEVTSDVGATASRAKSSISRGLFMRQDDNSYLLSMDVPGLHTKEVQVTINNGVLSIHGQHLCSKNPVTGSIDPLCIERSYDASFTFPSDADDSKADARIDAGVVFVKVPKVKEARGLGRVVALTNDAAEWVYDSTKETMENVRDSVVKNANDATASIKSVAGAATDAASSVTNTVKSAATDASKSASSAAAEASRSAASVASEASRSAAQATNTLKNSASSASAKATPVVAAAAAANEERGFFDRVKDTVRGANPGAAKGDIPVQHNADL